MFTGTLVRLRLVTLLVVVLAIASGAVPPAFAAHANGPTPPSVLPAPALGAAQDKSNPYFSVETITLGDGSQLERMTINGPATPPPGYEA